MKCPLIGGEVGSMQWRVDSYPRAAVEQRMKTQEVGATAKKIRWCQAAEIIGISDRQIRCWQEQEEIGPQKWSTTS
jgi:hypothetical protein